MASNGSVLSAATGEHQNHSSAPKTSPAAGTKCATDGVSSSVTTTNTGHPLPTRPKVERPAVPRKPLAPPNKPLPPVPKKPPPVPAKPPASPVISHVSRGTLNTPVTLPNTLTPPDTPVTSPDTHVTPTGSPLTPPETPPPYAHQEKEEKESKGLETANSAHDSSPREECTVPAKCASALSPKGPPPPLPKVPPRGTPSAAKIRKNSPSGPAHIAHRQPPSRPAPPVPSRKPASGVPVITDQGDNQAILRKPIRPHRKSDAGQPRSYHQVVVEENNSFAHVIDGKDRKNKGDAESVSESAETVAGGDAGALSDGPDVFVAGEKGALDNPCQTQNEELAVREESYVCEKEPEAPEDTQTGVSQLSGSEKLESEPLLAPGENSACDNPDATSAEQSVPEILTPDEPVGGAELTESHTGLDTDDSTNPVLHPSPTPPPVKPKPRKRTSVPKQSPHRDLPEPSKDQCNSASTVCDVSEEKQKTESVDESIGSSERLTLNCVHEEETQNSVSSVVSDEAEQHGSKADSLSGQPQASSGHCEEVEDVSTSDRNREHEASQKSVVPEQFSSPVCVGTDSVEKEARKESRSGPTSGDEHEDKVGENGTEAEAANASILPISLQDVGETCGMLREIENLLKARLRSASQDSPSPVPGGGERKEGDSSTPVRPPRPKKASKLKQLNLDSSSIDSSSTESLTTVGLSGKKAPPKPKRKNPPGVNRSLSDVTGMKNLVDQLTSPEREEKPFLPPRQQSLRLPISPKPPPLPPRNKSMEKPKDDGVGSESGATETPKAGVNASALTPAFGSSSAQSGHGAAGQSSAPGSVSSSPKSGTATVGRSASGRGGRKNTPRPTRKAPPPPPHAPSLQTDKSSTKSQSSDPAASQSSSADSLDKDMGYRKIANSSSPPEDINSVVPKTAVVGTMDSPSVTSEESVDHDYHEISDHLVREVSARLARTVAQVNAKEESPPPDLPPRSYKSQISETSSLKDAEQNVSDKKHAEQSVTGNEETKDQKTPKKEPLKQSASAEKTENENTEEEGKSVSEKTTETGSSEDSASRSSQGSQRAASLGGSGFEDVFVDRLRPDSTLSLQSNSSHSETGSGGQEVPTFDQLSSGSESENEDDAEKQAQKKEKKVYYIAEEMVKSEQVFVDVLKLLNVDFRVFISKKTEQLGHSVVPSETLNKILDYLPQLHSFSEILLKDLTDRIANWENQKKIADIFVKKGPFLKLYSSYIRNFEHANALLDEACKKHNSFGQALQQFEMSPRCASLALKHYMLKPIQRIPQYKLLLQDYLKHLTEDSPDYKDTITALNIVSEVADHANESMRHGDNVQKLLEIQRSLIGQFEVIQPGRVLIKKGELMKLSRKEMQPRMFFLFNDVLLYTTPSASGYRLNNILNLNGMKVVPPKLEEFKNEFNIISTQRSFTVAASTPDEREAWLTALWNAIEENSERYHTFRSMQQEPQTSLLDKDFVLGHKAPLWVPDARVTMCMLCLAEFSITWRRHHCRACGRIICGNCSENKAPLRYLMYKPARVCDDCYEKLQKEVEHQLQEDDEGPGAEETASASGSVEGSGLSISSLKARFQKIRRSGRDKHKSGMLRPAVLKEVHANDEGSDMSGYLWVAKNKKWKRLWFVVKGKVLYTYKASEDMAAIESMPLLGFEITRMTAWYQGAEPDLMFELKHQNTQPLVFKGRNSSTNSDKGTAEEGSSEPAPTVVSPHVKSSADTTTPRLIFRTDSAAATTKWLNVLREASLA